MIIKRKPECWWGRRGRGIYHWMHLTPRAPRCQTLDCIVFFFKKNIRDVGSTTDFADFAVLDFWSSWSYSALVLSCSSALELLCSSESPWKSLNVSESPFKVLESPWCAWCPWSHLIIVADAVSVNFSARCKFSRQNAKIYHFTECIQCTMCVIYANVSLL